MGCLCGGIAANFMTCLRRELGVSPSNGWDTSAHAALYLALSRMVDVQGDRQQTPEEIRMVALGAEPRATALYVGMYPVRYFVASSPFWSCIGVTRDEALAQTSAKNGAYFDAAVAVADHVRRVESGNEKPGGIPWWGWLLGGAAVGAGLWLLVRD